MSLSLDCRVDVEVEANSFEEAFRKADEEFWLYCWHFPGRRSEYGESVAWILTDKAMTKALVNVCGPQRKAYLVLEEARKYVVKGDWK